jgi:hypothetical protein
MSPVFALFSFICAINAEYGWATVFMWAAWMYV